MFPQDPLHRLPLERWNELQDAFKADWPRGINGYSTLEVQRQWASQGTDYDLKVYCPFGNVTNGMIALNEKDSFYEIIIQCPKDDTEKLTEALKKTNIIDWNRTIIVPYAPRNVIECLRKTVQEVDVELNEHRFLETFILENGAFKDVTLPQGITFGPVTIEHLDLVDSTWPNRYDTSKWHFRLLIKTNSGYGLYMNNNLISWVFIKETGPLQHLYTVEEHRKKGYAELLLKMASKIWLNERKPVFAFCHKDNISACKVYRKVGFVTAEQVAWCYLNKKERDALQCLPIERWSDLQTALKADWPRSISGYAALEIQKQWAEQGFHYDFKVYCPFGDVTSGMVAVNEKDTFYEIIIQCPKDDTTILEDALKKTKVIDWDREVIVPYAPQNVIKCLQNVSEAIGVEVTGHDPLETFILEEDKFGEVSLPPNITFGHVKLEHLDLVDSTWPHRYPNSSWYFKLLINTKSGYGLYLNNDLISWVFIKEAGALQHLYTIEEHRKKGYAELLLKLSSKIWMKEGKPVFAFCYKHNVNACKVYKKLGFVQTEPIAWCYINKKRV